MQVVGVPDKRVIEELCACIKLKEGEECTEEEIKNFCKGKVCLSFVISVTHYCGGTSLFSQLLEYPTRLTE